VNVPSATFTSTITRSARKRIWLLLRWAVRDREFHHGRTFIEFYTAQPPA
jgi:hypothetical protein